jgi:hypothetical protein
MDDERSIQNFEWAVYLNPMITHGIPLDIFQETPEGLESPISTFRGSLYHVYDEADILSNARLVKGIEQATERAPFWLQKEESLWEIPIPPEGIASLLDRLNQGKYVERKSPKLQKRMAETFETQRYPLINGILKIGEYVVDASTEKIYIKPRRARYGHTVWASTSQGRLFSFKFYGLPDTEGLHKNQGFYLEQVGPAVHQLAQSFLGERETLLHAGISSNGGDTRLYHKTQGTLDQFANGQSHDHATNRPKLPVWFRWQSDPVQAFLYQLATTNPAFLGSLRESILAESQKPQQDYNALYASLAYQHGELFHKFWAGLQQLDSSKSFQEWAKEILG